MTGKDFDTIVKGIISAAIMGLFVWTYNTSADVAVLKSENIYMKESLKEGREINKELRDAIVDLRIAVQDLKKD